MTDVSRLRVSDAERHGVVARLQEAAGEGRLTLDELDERVSEALAARTWADLDPLVDDLPEVVEAEVVEPEAEEATPALPMAHVGALVTLGLGAVAVPVSLGSALGPALGIVAALLGVLVLVTPGELSRLFRFAALGGITLGLLPCVVFIQLFLAFG